MPTNQVFKHDLELNKRIDMEMIKYKEVESKIINIRGIHVILDSDVAALYGVETKHINQAVRNNPDKFPTGYIIELDQEEWKEVRSKILTSPLGGGRTYKPRAFTEKGLYMLATILKSPRSVETTIYIIETFAQVREIKRTVIDILKSTEDQSNQKKIIERVGTLVGELIMPNENDFETVEIHTDGKFKFMGVLEFSKKIIKRPK